MPITRAFVDTNVLVYADDAAHAGKQQLARRLVADLLRSNQLVLSSQVLVEYAWVAQKKLGLAVQDIVQRLSAYGAAQVIGTDGLCIQRGFAIAALYAVSYWDSLILAAADTASVDLCYSEAMQHGRNYGGVRVVNPFA